MSSTQQIKQKFRMNREMLVRLLMSEQVSGFVGDKVVGKGIEKILGEAEAAVGDVKQDVKEAVKDAVNQA